MPEKSFGIPSLTDVWKIDSASSTTPSILEVPPVRTIPAGISFSKPFLEISAFTSSNNSTYLGSTISARDLLDNSRGGLPPTPMTSIVSSSFVNSATEQPCFVLSLRLEMLEFLKLEQYH